MATDRTRTALGADTDDVLQRLERAGLTIVPAAELEDLRRKAAAHDRLRGLVEDDGPATT